MSIKKGSPAEKIGIKVGDVLVDVQGKKVAQEKSIDAVMNLIVKAKKARDKINKPVSLTLTRMQKSKATKPAATISKGAKSPGLKKPPILAKAPGLAKKAIGGPKLGSKLEARKLNAAKPGLKPGMGAKSTVSKINSTPKKLSAKELEAAQAEFSARLADEAERASAVRQAEKYRKEIRDRIKEETLVKREHIDIVDIYAIKLRERREADAVQRVAREVWLKDAANRNRHLAEALRIAQEQSQRSLDSLANFLGNPDRSKTLRSVLLHSILRGQFTRKGELKNAMRKARLLQAPPRGKRTLSKQKPVVSGVAQPRLDMKASSVNELERAQRIRDWVDRD